MQWITVNIFGSEVSIAFDENSIHIYNAYPVKDNLKSRGYRWNPADKSWFLKPFSTNRELAELQGEKKGAAVPVKISEEATVEVGFPNSYSVLELRDYIDSIIKTKINSKIWIRGIVASKVKNYKWASYFDLKDENEKKDLFFRVEIRNEHKLLLESKLSESGICDKIEKDLPLFCQAELSISSRYSVDIKLKIIDIFPEYTKEKIKNQREITVDKLTELGIIARQKMLKLPPLITNIGLISSEMGTSCKDILAGMHPYENKYVIYFVDSRMEGGNAIKSIIAALDLLESKAKELSLDAIIIARGGGSEQSLSVFNDLELNKRVCNYSLPVLTAIGHEKDLTAIEICSHFTPTPSTPSGLGKLLQNKYLFLREELNSKSKELIKYFSNFHSRQTEKIRLSLRNVNNQFNFLIKFRKQLLRETINRFEKTVILKVKIQENQIKNLFLHYNEKFKNTIKIHRQKTIDYMQTILSRNYALYKNEYVNNIKTCLKLDFTKISNSINKNQLDLKKKTQQLNSYISRKLQTTQKNLNSLIELVYANEPQRILKKGFTLTIDEKEAVIKSLKQFKQSSYKKLRFFDGAVEINEKGEN